MASSLEFALRGEYITLEALLKATGVAAGTDARAQIAAGEVSVNGAAERRRGRKVRVGDVVVAAGVRVQVLGS